MKTKKPLKILLTSPRWKGALTALRSLGKRKNHINITAGRDNANAPTLFSRYVSRRLIAPPESEGKVFMEAVLADIAEEQYDIVIPISDMCTEYFSRYRDRISPYSTLFLPPRDLVDLAISKTKTYRFCLENGIRIPQTFFPENENDLCKMIKDVHFPCFLKAPKGSANSGNRLVNNADDLLKIFSTWTKNGIIPVVQEQLKDNFVGVIGLCWKGEVLNLFMFTVIARNPCGGTPVYARSVFIPRLLEIVKDIVKKTQWTGMIDLDFLYDNNEFLLLEINPRFSGTVGFAYRLGIDFPYQYIQLALTKDPTLIRPTHYRTDVVFRSVFPEEISLCLAERSHIKRFILRFLNPKYLTDIDLLDSPLLYQQLRVAKWRWKKHATPLSLN